MTAETSGKKAGMNRKTRRTGIFFFFAVALITALLLSAEFSFPDRIFGGAAGKRQLQKMTLRYEIHRETRRYLAQNQQALKEFEKKIRQTGNGDFELARKNIPRITRQFSDIAWNGKLCYKMTKDFLCRSNDAQTALEEVLSPAIITPCEHGNMLIRNELETFLLHLAEQENLFHAKLALLSGESGFFEGEDSARHQFLLDCRKIAETAKADAGNRSLVIAATALEAIFLRGTIRMTASAFRPLIVRIAAAGTTAGVCAAADGPLPVGDVVGALIGAGSLAWCGYDLYQISQVMPEEMRMALSRMIDRYQTDSRKQALETARKSIAAHQLSAKQMTQIL